MKYLVLGIALLGLACCPKAKPNQPHCDFDLFQSINGSSSGDVEYMLEYDYDRDGTITTADYAQFTVICDV